MADLNDGLIIDLFCGGGGATTGIAKALHRHVSICVNHDATAIAIHQANSPETFHCTEDIFQCNLKGYVAGRNVELMWASPDCTHFSKAKGTKPLSSGIRSLPWAVYQHAKDILPRVIIMENVEEIMTWGPLNEKGRPDEKHKGEEYHKFMGAMHGLGYEYKTFILNSADYGAPTARKRWYAVFRNDGKPIVCPEPTHAKHPNLFCQRPYEQCGKYIDWTDLGQSIFERKKPLADNTMRRIARGLKKFVIDSDHPYIVDLSSSRKIAAFIDKAYAGSYQGCSDPLPTITSVDHSRLVTAFLIQYHGETPNGGVRGNPLDEPIKVIDTANRYGLTSCFITKFYGTGTGQRCDVPLGTITTRDRFGLVTLPLDGERYAITDIRLRMLKPDELKRMQGFPETYIIDHDINGNPISVKSQVEKIGNSVVPVMAEKLVEANLGNLKFA